MTESLNKWVPPGILEVNTLAKTPPQILDIPGLFDRIHELQNAVGIVLTAISVLEGSGGGGGGQKQTRNIAAMTDWLTST